MRMTVLALLLIVAAGDIQAHTRRARMAACRAMCEPRMEACLLVPPHAAHRCQRRVLKLCLAEGPSACFEPTTTTPTTSTTSTTSTTPTTTSTVVAITTTTTVSDTSTTTTSPDYVLNPWTGPLPAPDVRGRWDTSWGLDDGTFTGDGCGYVDDPTTHVTASLLIAGDFWEVDPTTYGIPGVTATLGQLTDLLSPTATFDLDMASIGGGNDFPAKDTRGSVVLAGSTCDPDTGCCLSAEVDLYYGCSEPYCPAQTITLDIGVAAGFLWIERHCSIGPSCNTILFGHAIREQ